MRFFRRRRTLVQVPGEKSRGRVSFIAASDGLGKSLSAIGSSPLASRWAFITVRKYLVTVTPGTETGYWRP